ncbi:hypothetical protein F4604DRAFT_1915478 [Suillus subluteus]|nr:hypothetical protein F4604DRAFT_1915478 [Suillus subluteus]
MWCQLIWPYVEAGNFELYRQASQPIPELPWDTEEDRKKCALDYVPPAEQAENPSHQEAPTTSDVSTSLRVTRQSPAMATMMACDSQQAVNAVFDWGEEAAIRALGVTESLLPFNPPGPSHIGSQELDDSYSWLSDISLLSQQPLSLIPRPQTPTLPAFPSTSTSSAPPLQLTLPDTPITWWRKESEPWDQTTSLPAPLTTVPTFNFDGCPLSTPGITSSIIPQEIPVPHPIATNQLPDKVICPASTVTQLTVATGIDLIAMDAPTAAAPSPICPNAMVQGTGVEVPARDTTTTDAPAAQVEVQAGEDEPVATDQGVVRNRKGGKKGVEQTSTNSSPSVDIPLQKTGRVRQESTRMAQANMIGESAKRLRTGEVENTIQKKKRKSSA